MSEKVYLCISLVVVLLIAGCDQYSSDLIQSVLNPSTPSYEVYSMALSIQDAQAFQFRFGEIPNDIVQTKAGQDIPYSAQYIRGGGLDILFSPGASRAVLTEFGQGEVYRDIEDFLAVLGVAPEDIDILVLDHKHFDSIGNAPLFPNAIGYMQQADWDAPIDEFMYPNEIAELANMQAEKRLRFIEGDYELAPGIMLYQIPGHAPGQMAMTVNTADGQVTLAGDVVYTYENLRYDVPAAIGMEPALQLAAYQRVRQIMGPSDRLMASLHDLSVYERFPQVAERLVQIKLPLANMSIEEQQIRYLDDVLHDAWINTADVDTIMSLWSRADDVAYVDFEGNVYEGWEAIGGYHEATFEAVGGPLLFYTGDPQITIDGDEAIEHNTWGMTPDALDFRTTSKFRKEAGKWVFYYVNDME